MTFNEICSYHAKLKKEHYTGRVIFDYFEGNSSHKIKKEITETIGGKDEKEKENK